MYRPAIFIIFQITTKGLGQLHQFNLEGQVFAGFGDTYTEVSPNPKLGINGLWACFRP